MNFCTYIHVTLKMLKYINEKKYAKTEIKIAVHYKCFVINRKKIV